MDRINAIGVAGFACWLVWAFMGPKDTEHRLANTLVRVLVVVIIYALCALYVILWS